MYPNDEQIDFNQVAYEALSDLGLLKEKPEMVSVGMRDMHVMPSGKVVPIRSSARVILNSGGVYRALFCVHGGRWVCIEDDPCP